MVYNKVYNAYLSGYAPYTKRYALLKNKLNESNRN